MPAVKRKNGAIAMRLVSLLFLAAAVLWPAARPPSIDLAKVQETTGRAWCSNSRNGALALYVGRDRYTFGFSSLFGVGIGSCDIRLNGKTVGVAWVSLTDGSGRRFLLETFDPTTRETFGRTRDQTIAGLKREDERRPFYKLWVVGLALFSLFGFWPDLRNSIGK